MKIYLENKFILLAKLINFIEKLIIIKKKSINKDIIHLQHDKILPNNNFNKHNTIKLQNKTFK